MKLTKQLEREVRQVIDAYWDNYIKGDVKATASMLDDDYTQVGSAENEVFTNKKDAVKFLYETIERLKCETGLQRLSPLKNSSL